MVGFGRRVPHTRLLYLLAVLMSTATAQAEERSVFAKCKYTEEDGWRRFGESSTGQDVCDIAGELLIRTCGMKGVPSLEGDLRSNPEWEDVWYDASRFVGKDFPANATECICDRVMFNLLSACAGCQKWGWLNVTTTPFQWQTFTNYEDGLCHNNSGTSHKRTVLWEPDPPAWARSFHEDPFNPTAAQAQVNISSSVFASAFPSSTNPVVETSPAATEVVSEPAVSPSGPPIGAIVGGVIGGLTFLGMIAGLAYWLHCRKRRARDVAPSSEFLKPEYYATPPLLAAHERRDSAYRDEIEEEMSSRQSPTNRISWAGGLVTTRRHEDEDDEDCEMLPPFTQGTYIGPSPHEKGCPERRATGDTDITMRTNTTTTFLLSSASPTRPPGPSDHYT